MNSIKLKSIDGFTVNRIDDEYIFTDFGFPIKLHDVEVLTISGGEDEFPNIDSDVLRRLTLLELIISEKSLTGSQVRFIRQSTNHTLRSFGELLGVKNTAVCKWESKKDKATEMSYTTEVVMRMKTLIHIGHTDRVIKAFNTFPVGSFREPVAAIELRA